MGEQFSISLEGAAAQLGDVIASDVAKLILHAESAMAKAMGHEIHQPVKKKGAWRKAIAEAVRFRLVEVQPGSVVVVGRLPEVEPPDGALQLDGATSLGELGLRRAVRAFEDPRPSEVDVAGAWLQAAEAVGIGPRYDAVRLEYSPSGHGSMRVARLDRAAVDRLTTFVRDAGARSKKSEHLVGRLFEADFEKRTAKLRTPQGVVEVVFAEELDDDVQEALRNLRTLIGEITFDRQEARAVAIRVRKMTRSEQLSFAPDDFWIDKPVEQLIVEQGNAPVKDLLLLAIPGISDVEWDEFLKAIGH